jgi:hypothetical protein
MPGMRPAVQRQDVRRQSKEMMRVIVLLCFVTFAIPVPSLAAQSRDSIPSDTSWAGPLIRETSIVGIHGADECVHQSAPERDSLLVRNRSRGPEMDRVFAAAGIAAHMSGLDFVEAGTVVNVGFVLILGCSGPSLRLVIPEGGVHVLPWTISPEEIATAVRNRLGTAGAP